MCLESSDFVLNKDVTLVERELKEILKQFHIEHATSTFVTDRVHKVEVARRAYALKRAEPTLLQNKAWLTLINHPMPAMVQVLKTGEQAPALYNEKAAYYLTPWVQGDEKLNIEEAFIHLADFHRATKQEVSIYKHEWEDKLTELEARGRDYERAINHVLLYCEEQHYMSPFSFQFCTNFTRTMHIIQIFQRLVRTLKRELDEATTHSYCMNHGRLERSHMLWDQKLYLINFEKAVIRNPIYDLLQFFEREMTAYANGFYFQTYEKALNNYIKTYQLSRLEVLYFYILLMDPTDYVEEGERYRLQKTKQSMAERVMLQANRFRRMQLGMYLFNREEKRAQEKAEKAKESSD